MKTSFVALAALASIASAQFDNLPGCAAPCLVTALSSDTDCELTDFACQCQRTDLIPTVLPCIQEECTPEEEAQLVTLVEGVCSEAGQPITIGQPSEEPTPTPTPEESAPVTESPEASETSEIMPSLTDVVITTAIETPIETPPTTSFTGAAAMQTGMGGLAAAVVAGAAILL